MNYIEEELNKNENYHKMNEFLKIKKSLKSCMDVNIFINKMKEIIDESENFSFRSERSKKFIDKNNPEFILTYKKLNTKNIDTSKVSDMNKLTEKVTNIVFDEILSKASEFITESITDKEKFDQLFKDIPEEFSSKNIFNIYTIRVSIKDNAIIIKYFM